MANTPRSRGKPRPCAPRALGSWLREAGASKSRAVAVLSARRAPNRGALRSAARWRWLVDNDHKDLLSARRQACFNRIDIDGSGAPQWSFKRSGCFYNFGGSLRTCSSRRNVPITPELGRHTALPTRACVPRMAGNLDQEELAQARAWATTRPCRFDLTVI